MLNLFRSRVLSSGIAVASCATLVAVVPAGARGSQRSPTARRPPRAHAARALSVSDTAHLHYTSASGSLLLEQGSTTGTLRGTMKVRMNVGASLSGSFTIYAHGGTITGHGTAALHGGGVDESFAGTLTVSGGSGRYAHARGKAGLYGTFDRKNYALTIQTTGKLSY